MTAAVVVTAVVALVVWWVLMLTAAPSDRRTTTGPVPDLPPTADLTPTDDELAVLHGQARLHAAYTEATARMWAEAEIGTKRASVLLHDHGYHGVSVGILHHKADQ